MRALSTTVLLSLGLATCLVGGTALDGGAVIAQDTGTVYRFGTSKKHTNVTFVSEADVENIYGSTNVVSGQTFLNLDEGKGKCNIRIPIEHMKTGIETRDEHMRSDQWLDAAKYPQIQFRSSEIQLKPGKRAGRFEGTAKGTMSIHGVEKEITVPVKVRKVSDKLAKLIGDGEWVRVTTEFDVKLSDYGIEIPDGPVATKVSPVWQIKFDSYATSAKAR